MKQLNEFKEEVNSFLDSLNESRIDENKKAKDIEAWKNSKIRYKTKSGTVREIEWGTAFQVMRHPAHKKIKSLFIKEFGKDAEKEEETEEKDDKNATVDIDWAPDDEKEALGILRKFGLKGKDRGNGILDITGNKKNIIKYLTSDYYGLSKADIKDMFPSLVESYESEVNEAYEPRKILSVNSQIGKAKYSFNYYDGGAIHKDGSPFIGIITANNKKDFQKKMVEFIEKGYEVVNNVHTAIQQNESEEVNEEIKTIDSVVKPLEKLISESMKAFEEAKTNESSDELGELNDALVNLNHKLNNFRNSLVDKQ